MGKEKLGPASEIMAGSLKGFTPAGKKILVANIGGSLTPLGDPPLYLGFLKGVPFTWTFRLLVPWLFTTALVLAVYVVWDRRAHAAEARADPAPAERR